MNRSLLMKATSSEESPTPGYLYGELAKQTQEGQEVVEKMTKFLSDRLGRKEPIVRQKALQVIKHVCRRGDPSFRRSMHSHLPAVKSCLQFSGPPDPLKGDQPFKAVREAAKDALEAIFDNTNDRTPSALAQRIQGYGVSSNSSSQESYGSDTQQLQDGYVPGGRALPSETVTILPRTGTKYAGMGNPNFVDPRDQPKGFFERVKDRVDEYTEKASKTVATSGIQDWLGTTKQGGKATGLADAAGRDAYSSNGSYQGASLSTASSSSSSSFGGGGSWAPPQATFADPRSPRPGNYGKTGSAVSDGSYERGLIDDLCSRGGVRAVPAKDKVTSFLNACKTLDANIVMPILYEKLRSSDWKVQHKALTVCESLIQAGEEYESYVDYLDEHAEVLEDLRESQQPTVRNRCKKVWVLLYGAEASEEQDTEDNSASYTPQQPSSQQQEFNLLDFDDSSANRTTETKDEVPPAAPLGGGSGGLFGNMQVKVSQTTTKPAPSEGDVSVGSTSDSGVAGSAFNFLQASRVSEEKNGSQQQQDVDLMLGDTAPPQPPPPPSSSSSSSSIEDQLAGLSFSAESSTPLTSSGFTFLGSGKDTSSTTSAKSDNVGNAFDTLLQQPNTVNQNGFPTPLTPQAGVNPAQGMAGGAPLTPQMMAMLFQQQQQQMQMMQNNPQMMMLLQQQQQLLQQQMNQQKHMAMAGASMYGMPGSQGTPMVKPQSGTIAGNKVGGQTSKASTTKSTSTKTPDKFDFVSSAMAEMK